jgi:hypothetical protein
MAQHLTTLAALISASSPDAVVVKALIPEVPKEDVHVIYKGRALPIGWLVRQGSKGHFREALHLELVEHVHDLSRYSYIY